MFLNRKGGWSPKCNPALCFFMLKWARFRCRIMFYFNIELCHNNLGLQQTGTVCCPDNWRDWWVCLKHRRLSETQLARPCTHICLIGNASSFYSTRVQQRGSAAVCLFCVCKAARFWILRLSVSALKSTSARGTRLPPCLYLAASFRADSCCLNAKGEESVQPTLFTTRLMTHSHKHITVTITWAVDSTVSSLGPFFDKMDALSFTLCISLASKYGSLA